MASPWHPGHREIMLQKLLPVTLMTRISYVEEIVLEYDFQRLKIHCHVAWRYSFEVERASVHCKMDRQTLQPNCCISLLHKWSKWLGPAGHSTKLPINDMSHCVVQPMQTWHIRQNRNPYPPRQWSAKLEALNRLNKMVTPFIQRWTETHWCRRWWYLPYWRRKVVSCLHHSSYNTSWK